MAGIEEQFVLLALGLVVIGIRMAVRWRQVGPTNWELDDYLMPLTGVSEKETYLALQLSPPFAKICLLAVGNFILRSIMRSLVHQKCAPN